MGHHLLADILLRVKELEDGDRRAHRLLEGVVEECEFADRVVKLEEGNDEDHKGLHRHAAGNDLHAADVEQQGNGDGADDVHQRGTDGLDADRPQVGAEQAPGSFLEAQNLPEFRGEGLHDAVAGNGFVEDVLDFSHAVLAGAGADSDGAADFASRGDDNRNEKQKGPTEASAKADDDGDSEEEGEGLLEEFAKDGTHGGLHTLHVIDEGGEDGAGGVLVEEAGGAAQDGFVEVIAEVGNAAVAGVVDQVGAQVVADALENGGADESDGNDGPGIVEVRRDDGEEIKLVAWRQVGEEGVAARVGAGIENGAQDGAENEKAERLKHAHGGEQHDA